MKEWACVRRLLMLGVGLSLLVSCSGGGSSGGGTPPSGQMNLPPDPGPAGMATLAGIDSNNNGVRDDAERYIALTYPATTDASTRNALTQYTKTVQAMLLDAAIPAASVTHATDLDAALACLVSQRPADSKTVYEGIQEQVLNTFDRIAAYLQADAQLGGVSIPLQLPNQPSATCVTS